ncbi:MAG: hypothetical protein CMO81_04380 [Waddliaceae bacterium]|nr:hypothetical protein [Waddliaceae bacterium]|tara:strand:+ start:418 stop:732 length:315 start_codon:yes stop_codon:yes gene_type:complete
MKNFTFHTIKDTYAQRLYIGVSFPGQNPVVLGRGISAEPSSFLIPRLKFSFLGEVFNLNRNSFKKHLKDLNFSSNTKLNLQSYYTFLQKNIFVCSVISNLYSKL